MKMGIKREHKRATESGGETFRLNKGGEEGKRGRGEGGLPFKFSTEKNFRGGRERELELWWAGLGERGKQPRLTGIEPARRGRLRQTDRQKESHRL